MVGSARFDLWTLFTCPKTLPQGHEDFLEMTVGNIYHTTGVLITVNTSKVINTRNMFKETCKVTHAHGNTFGRKGE